MSRRAEWREQVLLCRLLDRWLDPDCSVWTATDPVAGSAVAGAMRRKRGVKAGVPDTLVVHRGKLIAIEMKSPAGKCSESQRAFRERLLRARVQWWVCCSANAAMVALRKSGVRFRQIIHEDGKVERWKERWLASWEIPRTDPSEPRPWHPKVREQRRAARQQWRARKREREAAQLAAAHNAAGLPGAHDARCVNNLVQQLLRNRNGGDHQGVPRGNSDDNQAKDGC